MMNTLIDTPQNLSKPAIRRVYGYRRTLDDKISKIELETHLNYIDLDFKAAINMTDKEIFFGRGPSLIMIPEGK